MALKLEVFETEERTSGKSSTRRRIRVAGSRKGAGRVAIASCASCSISAREGDESAWNQFMAA